MISTILMWAKDHKRIAVEALLTLVTALSILLCINMHKNNKSLSDELKMQKNNIEAYLGLLNDSLLANRVLKLDIKDLLNQNDSILNKMSENMKKEKISATNVTTAATLTQIINVNKSKEVGGENIIIIKDSIYKDTILYNDLTTVIYEITKDSVNIALDILNTQYLYIYKKKEYKNKKNFFKRLITLDWKKITKYNYEIINTNDLLNTSDVRVVEQIDD